MAVGAPGSEVVLETSRLLLRPWRVAEALVQHELWIERDPRVPPHRRIDAHGHGDRGLFAVVGWARSSGCARLWATVWDWNTASRRVLAKVGFTETERKEVDAVYGTTLITTKRL